MAIADQINLIIARKFYLAIYVFVTSDLTIYSRDDVNAINVESNLLPRTS